MPPKKPIATVGPQLVSKDGRSGAQKAVPKTHPTTLEMVVEALKKSGDRRGTSVQAIRAYILSQYMTVDPVRLRVLLRKALAKGLEDGTLVRPHNSTAIGAQGRFKLSGKKAKKVGENADPNLEKPPVKKPKAKAGATGTGVAQKKTGVGNKVKKSSERVTSLSKTLSQLKISGCCIPKKATMTEKDKKQF
ncbi:protein B4 isoform X2 [Protopterus annectens]|uniref:protein B4 isoform X2 n=1 Tax=Protopterus annectens TaxID=7888 RepID=UPI001CFAA4F6|nr:protein B4 isoform X2 [Protopterus annectens]